MKGNRVIIPTKLREHVINILHETHLGITKTKQLARDTVFWPNIDQQITNRIEKCQVCQNSRNTPHKEPLVNHHIPCSPYEKVGTDLFEIDNQIYIIIVDCYSKYLEIALLTDTSSKSVIKVMKEKFA